MTGKNPEMLQEILSLVHSCQMRAALCQLDHYFTEANSQDDDSAEYRFLQVRVLHERQDLKRLRSVCDFIGLAASGGKILSAQEWVNLGYSRILDGDPLRARVAYKEAECLLRPDQNLTLWLRVQMGLINCTCQLQGPRAALDQFYSLDLDSLMDGVELSPANRILIVMLKAYLLREAREFHGALTQYWRAYSLVPLCGSLYLNYLLLFDLAKAHLMIGEADKSAHYFSLVESGIEAGEMTHLHRRLLECKSQIPFRIEELHLDEVHGRVMVGKNNWIEFGRQSLLQNLFSVLARNEGRPLDHSALASLIWNEDYDPRVHDNKIYVTIRRLRELLEPSAVRSSLILKDRHGYFIPFPVRIVAGILGRGGAEVQTDMSNTLQKKNSNVQSKENES